MQHGNYGMQNPYGNPSHGGMGYGGQMNNSMMNMPQQMPQGYSKNDMKDQLNGYKHYFIILEMKDGQQYEGIVEDIDAENVYVLMPVGDEDDDESPDQRQWGYGGGFGPGYGWGGGYGGGYGYPRRFRRFRRYRFPFFGIGRWFFPFFW
ncbi:hypothetical protein [Pontibacillus sp. HMF3514]|uniref:hypothetical protein n=1 Tax=Pontibacillus sp. HMF3514 TaxID=2692425 RepID=UPI00131FD580|nr:hypothetical protein [Pontibacillus sp. HMF3514]QHE51020.1 hypothetical protein GS400_02730 [Pontibacillus sp. HMF3514]